MCTMCWRVMTTKKFEYMASFGGEELFSDRIVYTDEVQIGMLTDVLELLALSVTMIGRLKSSIVVVFIVYCQIPLLFTIS